MIRVGIVGATGYGGRELIRLLLAHPGAEITAMASTSVAGEEAGHVLPAFRNILNLRFEPFNPAALAAKCDVVYMAVPSKESMEPAAELVAEGVRVIDIGPDFRLKDARAWEQYYGAKHRVPNLLAEAVYGMPAYYREQLATAKLVAVPGCYPISIITALRPLLDAPLSDVPVVIDSVSGASGAGRSLSEPMHFAELNENVKAYKLGSHQHIPEIEQELLGRCMVQFTPHVGPYTRGILTTITLRPTELFDPAPYFERYRSEPFVRVLGEGTYPEVKYVRASNYCDVGWHRDTRTGNLLLVSAVDNLMGGTAGMAIQCMNIQFGLDETAGLRFGGDGPMSEKTMEYKSIEGGVCAPAGFTASGVAAGIKKPGSPKLDSALVFSDRVASAAGAFTKNLLKSAPTKWTEGVCIRGEARAIFLNSGNSNAVTGQQGVEDTQRMAECVSGPLDIPITQVCVLSTGVIGVPLPMDRVEQGIAGCIPALSIAGGDAAATAIMTTDTVKKEMAIEVALSSGTVRMGAMAKGSGMIRPDMATMFCIVTCDAAIESELLSAMLKRCVALSFNCICVDNDMSTSDAVVCLCNGAAGVTVDAGTGDAQAFEQALLHVCIHMAQWLVRDGEGATKYVEIEVTGTEDDEAAKTMARSVAQSQLCKTAFAGEDANWGRIACAVGYAGVPFQPERLGVTIGGVEVLYEGLPTHYAEADAAAVMKQHDIRIVIKVGEGPGFARFWTSDLTHDYISINADYRT